MYSVCAGLRDGPVFDTDDQLCFLPLCHILERVFSVNAPIAAASTINFAESPETIFDNLQEVSPQTFVAVPRLWEKIYSQVAIRIGDATGMQKWAYSKALKAGAARADCLAESKAGAVWHQPRLPFLGCGLVAEPAPHDRDGPFAPWRLGAAPISPDLLHWYHSIGVPVLEGYGMTESSGVISINSEATNKFGTVGPALPGAQIRVTPEGEVQYKAGNVFQGYWKNPEKTAETFTEDGWLRTGDVGMLDNRRVPDNHRPPQGHHHHRRRQEHHPGRDREQAQVLPLYL